MASYYYLISSLPMISSDSKMPFSYEKFLSLCENTVSKKAYDILLDLSVDSTEGPLISEWADFYQVLRNEMIFQRLVKLGRPAKQPDVKDDEISRTVTEAVNAANPLDAELRLLKLEFARLDGLTTLHTFDDYVLFGYALKLKLLERLTVFDKDRGKEEFIRLSKGIDEKIVGN